MAGGRGRGRVIISDATNETISHMYILGSNIQDIHNATRVSRKYIFDYLVKFHNYKPRDVNKTNIIPKSRIPEIQELLDKGLTFKVIAEQLNYGTDQLRKYIKTNKLIFTVKNKDKINMFNDINCENFEKIKNTKFYQHIKKIEELGINYWLENDGKRGTSICTNCASCKKEVKKRSTGLNRTIELLPQTNGKIYCQKCIHKLVTKFKFSDKRGEKKKGEYIGVYIHYKYIYDNGKFISRSPYGFATRIKFNGKQDFIKIIIDPENKPESKLLAVLYREKYIVENNKPHLRNFNNLEFIELLKKYFPKEVEKFQLLLEDQESFGSLFVE